MRNISDFVVHSNGTILCIPNYEVKGGHESELGLNGFKDYVVYSPSEFRKILFYIGEPCFLKQDGTLVAPYMTISSKDFEIVDAAVGQDNTIWALGKDRAQGDTPESGF